MLGTQFYQAFASGEMPGQIGCPVRGISQEAVFVELRLSQYLLHGGALPIYALA